MIMSIDEITRTLTAPGSFFEMEEIDLYGIKTRVWKNALPCLGDIFKATKDYGEKTYLVYEGERVSYSEHYRIVCKLAHILGEEFKVKKGERVAIAMRNYPEWIMAFWAIVSIGAIVVPLNAWWKGEELAYGLSDSGSSVLFADSQRIDYIKERLPDLNLKAVICTRDGKSLPPEVKDFYGLLKSCPDYDTLPERMVEPDDEAAILYTSGTTGFPKGAVVTHRNYCTIVVSALFVGARAMLRQGKVPPVLSGIKPQEQLALFSSPLFHTGPFQVILVPHTLAGNSIVMMYKWDPERALELIEQEKIKQIGGVPTMILQLLESPDFPKRDTATIQSVTFGGAPAPLDLSRRIEEAFPEATFGNGYGLTEANLNTMNFGMDYIEKPDSVGVSVPVCDVKVMDIDGKELPHGGIGELWIKGPNVVKGYWNKPEATEQTFTEGWLHSGDIGRIDKEGFVYILDRTKEMLIRGGENIYCAEIENVLCDHPAVMEAAIVGIPHRILGEEVGAVVQITPGAKLTEEDLKAHVAKRLAAFKVPVRIILQEEPLINNVSGKIIKRELKKYFK